MMTDNNSSVTSTRKTRFLLTALEGTFWPAMCAGYMLVILLQEKGFSNTAIGTVLSVNAIISILAQPLWGMMSDFLKSTKKIFLLGISFSTLILSSLYFIKSSFVIIVLIFFDIFFRCSLASLLDNWVVSKTKEDARLDYGFIRVAGSITYSLVSYLYGAIMVHHPTSSILIVNFFLGLITIFFAIITPDRLSAPHPESKHPLASNPLASFKPLINNRKYLAIILLVTFNSIATNCILNFMPNFLANVGGTSSQAAFAQGIRAIGEIPFFLFSGFLLYRFTPKLLATLSSLLTLFSLTGIFIAASPIHIMISVIFLGASYSLMLTAKLRYILDIVPDHITATAFTLVSAFEYGLASTLSNAFSGYMLDHYPVKLLNIYTICSVLLGITLFLLISKVKKTSAGQDLSAT